MLAADPGVRPAHRRDRHTPLWAADRAFRQTIRPTLDWYGRGQGSAPGVRTPRRSLDRAPAAGGFLSSDRAAVDSKVRNGGRPLDRRHFGDTRRQRRRRYGPSELRAHAARVLAAGGHRRTLEKFFSSPTRRRVVRYD